MSTAEARGRHATSMRSMRPPSSTWRCSFPLTVMPAHSMVKNMATSRPDANVSSTWILPIVSSRPERLLTTVSLPSKGSGKTGPAGQERRQTPRPGTASQAEHGEDRCRRYRRSPTRGVRPIPVGAPGPRAQDRTCHAVDAKPRLLQDGPEPHVQCASSSRATSAGCSKNGQWAVRSFTTARAWVASPSESAKW
jgi:hypothetical protein